MGRATGEAGVLGCPPVCLGSEALSGAPGLGVGQLSQPTSFPFCWSSPYALMPWLLRF